MRPEAGQGKRQETTTGPRRAAGYQGNRPQGGYQGGQEADTGNREQQAQEQRLPG